MAPSAHQRPTRQQLPLEAEPLQVTPLRLPQPLVALLLGTLIAPVLQVPGSRAAALPFSTRTAALVQAICQSAFLAEMERAGQVPPAGMADYACTCVTRRLAAGGGIDQARSVCRQQTAQRYPLHPEGR